MKKIYFAIAALAAVCSCQKNVNPVAEPQNDGQTITISADAGVDATKITMGEKTATAYPMSWDADEHFYLREIATPVGGEKETVSHYVSSSFAKNDAHNSKITFDVAAQTIEGTYDYAAVYPCHPTNPKTNLDNGVRYGGDDLKNRISYALSNAKAQVPSADAPDTLTHIYAAYDLGKTAQASKISLNFQSVVSYGKMTIKNFPALAADETPTQITITGPSDRENRYYTRIMSGRVFKYFHATAEHQVGDVVGYSAGSTYNYIKVDPKNIAFNTTGFDIWFTTLPINLTTGDSLTVAVTTNKNTYSFIKVLSKNVNFNNGAVSEFTIDYNKCITPYKTLVFDFSTNPGGWPSGATNWTSKDLSSVTLPYKLGETTYNFIGATCTDGTTRGWAWGWQSKAEVNFFCFNTQRFFGLPALEGYKLVTVKFKQEMGTNTSRKAGITAAISDQTKQVYIPGGDLKVVGTNGDEYSFTLTQTTANTVYYIAAVSASTGIATLSLTYEKVDQ